jgi:hypothetical protein
VLFALIGKDAFFRQGAAPWDRGEGLLDILATIPVVQRHRKLTSRKRERRLGALSVANASGSLSRTACSFPAERRANVGNCSKSGHFSRVFCVSTCPTGFGQLPSGQQLWAGQTLAWRVSEW